MAGIPSYGFASQKEINTKSCPVSELRPSWLHPTRPPKTADPSSSLAVTCLCPPTPEGTKKRELVCFSFNTLFPQPGRLYRVFQELCRRIACAVKPECFHRRLSANPSHVEPTEFPPPVSCRASARRPTNHPFVMASKLAWSKSTRIKVMIGIDTAFFFLELICGFLAHSLALTADAFHMVRIAAMRRDSSCMLQRRPLFNAAALTFSSA